MSARPNPRVPSARQRAEIGHLERRRGRDAHALRERHLRVALLRRARPPGRIGLGRLLSRERTSGTVSSPASAGLCAPLARPAPHRASSAPRRSALGGSSDRRRPAARERRGLWCLRLNPRFAASSRSFAASIALPRRRSRAAAIQASAGNHLGQVDTEEPLGDEILRRGQRDV